MKSNNSSIQETTPPVSVYITYSVIVPILCIIGIVGNSLSIVILSRKSLKRSIIYAYLKGTLQINEINFKRIKKYRKSATKVTQFLISGLAVVDIAYLFFVSFECYFVLHGTLWHESPAVPPLENYVDEHYDIVNEWQRKAGTRIHNSSINLQESNPFHFYPINAYPWSKYEINCVAQNRLYTLILHD